VHELRLETELRFGDASVNDMFESAFKMLPLMAKTSNGIFCAHGGIPKMKDWAERSREDYDLSLHVTWGDAKGYGIQRGFGDNVNFSREELFDFLGDVGANLFIRGHDYSILGSSIFKGKCLTIMTSRRYRNYCNTGVLLASASMDREVRTAGDLTLQRLIGDKWSSYEIAEKA
jgi:hypothetical protein